MTRRQPGGSPVRPRLQLLAAAGLVGVAVTVPCAALRVLGAAEPAWTVPLAVDGCLLALAVAAGFSAGVRRQSERVLVVAAEAACLATLALVALAVAVATLGRRPDDGGVGFTGPVLVGAAVAAALAAVVRERARQSLERAVRGSRYAPDDVVRSFGEQASQGVELGALLSGLAETARESMSLSRAEIWTGVDSRLVVAASVPDLPVPPASDGPSGPLDLAADEVGALSRTRLAGPGWLSLWVPRLAKTDRQQRVVPARAGGSLLGLLVVERPAEAHQFSEAEDRLLAELGTRLGTVLHNRHLDANLRAALDDLRGANAELRISRARLVAAADAERRRIERDLHDGAQQQLVSLAVGVRLVRELVTDDPAAADEFLAEMADQVSETIGQLRDLAHGIYPPLLRSAGLTEALRAAATRAAVGVTVQADGVGRYDSEVEAAVYFCCLEALQNAAKHAPSSEVRVLLTGHDDTLSFDVADDGPGFERTATDGHGLVNMADRIGAVGGTVRWERRAEGGTLVRGAVPVHRGAAAGGAAAGGAAT